MKLIRLSDILELPIAERLMVVDAIWDSIAGMPDSLVLTNAQRIELDRRLQEYRREPNVGASEET